MDEKFSRQVLSFANKTAVVPKASRKTQHFSRSHKEEFHTITSSPETRRLFLLMSQETYKSHADRQKNIYAIRQMKKY